MAWTQYSAPVVPLCLTENSNYGHNDDIPALKAKAQQQLRKSKSYGDVLRPLGSLARVVRDPTGLVKSVGDVVWSSLAGEEDIPRILGGSLQTPLKDPLEEAHRRALYVHMGNATSYDEWLRAATELDEIEGNNAWKRDPMSDEYNVALVHNRLTQLDEARLSGDPRRMLRLIRTDLTRGLGGMGDQRLYSHTHTGTKELIERYIDSARETIATFLEVAKRQDGQAGAMDPKMIREELLRSRQSFGRSAVLLSGGGTFGMNHIGVVKALFENKLLPRILSGASAGSIVCAVLCVKTDEEIPLVLEKLTETNMDIFEREGDDAGVYSKVMRFLTHGSLFDISNLIRLLQGLVGNMTFLEAYNRTRRVLNICVSSSSSFDAPRLLNYITAPDVMIWSAVAASCSVPFFFSPATLQTKDRRTGEHRDWNPSPQLCIDGSVDNDLPMARLAELFNVNHFVVSQVNPHVVPFMNKDDSPASSQSMLQRAAAIARDETLHRMHIIAELGIMPSLMTKTRSILGQKYSGDITIYPHVSYSLIHKALQNPTREFIEQAVSLGEQATWPKLARIRNHVAIELALDAAVHEMINRAAFSADEVAVRRRRLADMSVTSYRPKTSVLLRPAGSETALNKSGSNDSDGDDNHRKQKDTMLRLGGQGRARRRRPLSVHGTTPRPSRRKSRPESIITHSPAASFVSTFSLTPSFVPQAPGSTTTLPTMPTYTARFVQPEYSRYYADIAGTAPAAASDSDDDDDADEGSSTELFSDGYSSTAGGGPMSSPPTHDSGDEFPGIAEAASAAHKSKSSSKRVRSDGSGASKRWRLFTSSSSPATPSGSFMSGSAFTMSSSAAANSDGAGEGIDSTISGATSGHKASRKGMSRAETEYKRKFYGNPQPPSSSNTVREQKKGSFMRKLSPKGSGGGALQGLGLGLTAASRGRRRGRE